MTKDATLALIRSVTHHADPHGMTVDAIWTARSEWVLTRYGDFIETKVYPYLARVAEWIAKGEGWTLNDEEIKHLTTLVYHAADEWRTRTDAAEGWQAASDAALEAFVGKTVQVRIEGMLGDSLKICRVVRVSNGRIALMPPRSRTKGYWATPDRRFRTMTTPQEGAP